MNCLDLDWEDKSFWVEGRNGKEWIYYNKYVIDFSYVCYEGTREILWGRVCRVASTATLQSRVKQKHHKQLEVWWSHFVFKMIHFWWVGGLSFLVIVHTLWGLCCSWVSQEVTGCSGDQTVHQVTSHIYGRTIRLVHIELNMRVTSFILRISDYKGSNGDIHYHWDKQSIRLCESVD